METQEKLTQDCEYCSFADFFDPETCPFGPHREAVSEAVVLDDVSSTKTAFSPEETFSVPASTNIPPDRESHGCFSMRHIQVLCRCSSACCGSYISGKNTSSY